MALKRQFKDLGFKLVSSDIAYSVFKELVVPKVEDHLGKSKIGRVSVEKVIDIVIDSLEQEMEERAVNDSGSINFMDILNNLYSNPRMRQSSVSLYCTKIDRAVKDIYLTQPGIELWKLLRLCYLKDKDYQQLLEKDSPQLLMNYLVEGNTRLLFSYLKQQESMPVNVVTIRENPDMRDDLIRRYKLLNSDVRDKYGFGNVTAHQICLCNELVKRYKGLARQK
jgi:hypothetical protein